LSTLSADNWLGLIVGVLLGRGKAQAATLRRTKQETVARRLIGWKPGVSADALREESVPGTALALGDHVVVEAGHIIPGDGDVVEGVASVDESAITGESAPVIRESGGDRSAVTGGSRVLSDRIIVKITSKQSIVIMVALVVALIPTTIGALLSAIGIAGMDRLVQRNVLAMSGRAVGAAGDVNTLLLDKTGTITIGNRQASEFLPVDGVSVEELADAAQLSSLADYTPEGRSIVVLAKQQFGLRERSGGELPGAEFVEFTAQTRMSGVDTRDGRQVRKGASSAVREWVRSADGTLPPELGQMVDAISAVGGTPLVVAERGPSGTSRALGVIHLKDIVKEGIRERFAELRKMGIRTVMITGDNPLASTCTC
jgi:potassium-transporting ATPase ATP-binding subunit